MSLLMLTLFRVLVAISIPTVLALGAMAFVLMVPALIAACALVLMVLAQIAAARAFVLQVLLMMAVA